jgi:hypothetical protein
MQIFPSLNCNMLIFLPRFCFGDVLFRRRFVSETFCYRRRSVTEMFCYGDVLYGDVCRGDVLCGDVLYVRHSISVSDLDPDHNGSGSLLVRSASLKELRCDFQPQNLIGIRVWQNPPDLKP